MFAWPKGGSGDGVLLVAALVIATCLNGRFVTEDCLAIDEHVSFWIADARGPANLFERSTEYSATPPLSFWLQRVSIACLGHREWVFRLPATISFLATIVAVWWIGRTQLPALSGGLAALLLATQPAVQDHAVTARPYSLGFVLGLLAMRTTMSLVAGCNRWRWVCWAITNFALVQTHYLFAGFWISQVVLLIGSPGPWQARKRRTLGAIVAFLLIGLTVMPGLLSTWERRAFLNWTTRTPSLGDLGHLILPVDSNWLRTPAWWLLWLGLFGAALVMDRLKVFVPRTSRSPKPYGAALKPLLLFSILPMAVTWTLGRFWQSSLAADRYLAVYLPECVLLISGLLCLLPSRLASLILAIALAVSWQTQPSESYFGLPSIERLHVPVTAPNAVDRSWRAAIEDVMARLPKDSPSSATPALVLVASGLTEMSLVPAYLSDATFHDYASCRFGRFYARYRSGEAQPVFQKWSLPMFWTPESRDYFRRRVSLLCEEHAGTETRSSQSPHFIELVGGIDTDLLRVSVGETGRMLRDLGLTEVRRVERDGVLQQTFSCRRPIE